jgi:hypothetical protein
MEGKKRRGARPAQSKASRIPSQSASPEVVRNRMDAALPAGPEHFWRDLETFRCAFLAARNDTEDKGVTGVYSAFEALALSAAKAQDEMEQEGQQTEDLWDALAVAQKLPSLMVIVPAWALVAIQAGWCRARFCEVADDGRKGHRLPLNEAFGLGSGGDRTVFTKHRNADRDYRIATAIASCLQQHRDFSENKAIEDTAAQFKVSKSVAFAAWKRYQEAARNLVSKDAGFELSESRQPKNKK